jgi:tol-pal system protein YbgF
LFGATCAALLLSSCGGAGPETRADKRDLEVKLAELRAQSRRDRLKIHDLENQILMMGDRGGGGRVQRGSVPAKTRAVGDDDVVPDLPVEVVDPEMQRGLQGPPMRDTSAPSAAVEGEFSAGVDEQGTEIVYAGDALAKTAVRPSGDRYHMRRKSAAWAGADPSGAAPQELAPLGESGDRLPVTREAPPTVEKRVREAHSPAQADRTRRPPNSRAPATSGEAAAEYRRYYRALQARDHATAVAGFESFLARYPEHDYANNAQYWLGEAYYDQKQFSTALAEFQKVIDRYPQGNKVPDALLKIGYCQLALGDRGAALNALRRVVTMHPTSSPAALAARKLKELEE